MFALQLTKLKAKGANSSNNTYPILSRDNINPASIPVLYVLLMNAMGSVGWMHVLGVGVW